MLLLIVVSLERRIIIYSSFGVFCWLSRFAVSTRATESYNCCEFGSLIFFLKRGGDTLDLARLWPSAFLIFSLKVGADGSSFVGWSLSLRPKRALERLDLSLLLLKGFYRLPSPPLAETTAETSIDFFDCLYFGDFFLLDFLSDKIELFLELLLGLRPSRVSDEFWLRLLVCLMISRGIFLLLNERAS